MNSFRIEHLGVSFNTASKDFTFTCEGKFEVEGTEVDTVVRITITHPHGATKPPQIDFHGEVMVGTLKFIGEFKKEQSAQAFLLSYSGVAARN